MIRRRALMSVGGSPSSEVISSLTQGQTVKILENGTFVEFVYIGLNSDGNAVVMRGTHLTNQRNFNSSAAQPEYQNSNLDVWLLNTVLPYYTGLQSYFVDSNITYANYDDSYAETILTIQRKIYVPSYYEVTGSGNEGGLNFLPALRTYKDTTTDNTARSTGTMYWTRTEFSSSNYPNRVIVVANNGACTRTSNFQASNSTSPKARPVLSLSPNTPITHSGNDIVVGT